MDIAVVGAGPAGAGVCYALRETDATVTVFEKSRGVCGRAATRRNGDRRYDHGANYVKSGSERVDEIVTERLPTDGLADIEEPVWTFDESGTITEGEDRDGRKWTYEEGITQVAKRLFAETDATVDLETRVGRLSHSGRWRVIDEEGEDLGTYDAVVLTPPAPQTGDILAATEWADSPLVDLEAVLESVPYRSIYSVILGYDFEIETPWYGLVNPDREHAIGWLSREELKPGHVPDGESLLVVQMSPDWTDARFDDPKSEVVDEAAALTAELLDDQRLADPEWTDTQRWRYALPNDGVDTDLLREAEEDGLYFAGDWMVGDGRVHLALENGLDVGDRLAKNSD
ncbi:NAD(P)/FAD-dependent oxidoreductase [Natronomonas sp.]|uniref:NAD(P)/FAD-dependent oxidoreductase n=1 Tax=Natronomonas sp. TaxID=2184060 RepID=UPI002FC3263D